LGRARKQRSITRLQERSGDLSTEHGHLVAKHDDLDRKLVTLGSAESKELEQSDERHVEERQGHGEV
jgi:hypothetical protein